MTTFTIDRSGFATLCPPLAADERARLESSILEHGCRDPLVVWIEENVLLDGHNREQICRKHGIPYMVVGVSLPDRAAAHAWVIDNQLARRNLTPQQRLYLLGKRYEAEKRPSGERTDLTSGHSDPRSSEAIAESEGVSEKTVRRAADFARNVDRVADAVGPKARTAILTGGIKMTRAQVAKAAEKGVRSMKDLRDVAKKPVRRKPSPRPDPPAPAPARDEFADVARAAETLTKRVAAARAAVQESEGDVPGVTAALEPLRRLRSEIVALIAAHGGQE